MATAREVLLDRFTTALENGVVPWKKPWTTSSNGPANYVTGKPYSGINILLCLCSDYSNPYFLTFNQITSLGGKLKKGSKGIPLAFYKNYTTTDENAEEEGEEQKRFVLRYFTVFRWEDTEGIPEKKPEGARADIEPIQVAEAIWESYEDRPALVPGGDKAFYSPGRDCIGMPARNSFTSADRYYSTLFHEMIHSTGAAKRLDRPELRSVSFGSESYSREELVAEIGAAFLVAEAGIETDEAFNQSSSYIAGWLKALKDDPGAIFAAAGRASKAANYILARESQKAEADEGMKAAA